MKVIQREIVVPAGATVDNVFAGSAFEYPPTSMVACGVTGSATGLQITLQAGGTVVLEESPPIIKTTFPIIPDEMFYNFAAVQSDRLVLRARNTTGGNLTLRTLCQIQEVQVRR